MPDRDYKQVALDRIDQLVGELTKGQAIIAKREGMREELEKLDLEAPQLQVKMLRINAAIQALEEVLGMREIK